MHPEDRSALPVVAVVVLGFLLGVGLLVTAIVVGL